MADGAPHARSAPRALGARLGYRCATVPSLIAYWTHSLGVAKLMFWAYIPAIYFFIGPCMALVLNLAPPHMRSTFTAWSVLVGNVFNLIVAPQFVGILSDWFARCARLGCGGIAARRCWCSRPPDSGRPGISSGGEDGRPGDRTRRRLLPAYRGNRERRSHEKPCAGPARRRRHARARSRCHKVLNDDAHFAEGPVWYHGKLYYVEYDRNSVTIWDGSHNRCSGPRQAAARPP